VSDEQKKDGFYVSVELPKGYEPKAGDSITVTTKGRIIVIGDSTVLTTDETKCVINAGTRAIGFPMNTDITWHATCWKHGPLTEDGCETTCLLPANHDGEHDWTSNDEIMG
jgi:hypothetical protein